MLAPGLREHAGVKRDPLADQNGVLSLEVAVEGEDDHARLAGRAHANGNKAAHAVALCCLVVNDFDLDIVVFLGPLFSFLSECHGVHVVGRAVAKVARKMNAAHDRRCAVNGCRKFRGVAFLTVDSSGKVDVVFVLFLVEVVAVVSQHHPFSECGHVLDISIMEHDGQFVAVDFLARCNHGCSGLPVGMVVDVAFFAQAHEHGFTAIGAHQRHACVGFCLEVTVLEYPVDLAFERSGDSLDNLGQGFFSFKKGQYEGSVDVVS